MEKLLKYFLMVMIIMTITVSFQSCGDDDSPQNNGGDQGIPSSLSWQYDKLKGTSWKMVSTNRSYSKDAYSMWKDAVITFSSETYDEKPTKYFKLYISGFKGVGYWYFEDNGKLTCITPYVVGGAGLTGVEAGSFIQLHGAMVKVGVDYLDSYTIKLTDDNGKWNKYTKSTGGNSGSSDHHYPCSSCDESGKCWNCNGKGTDPITNKKCNTCSGTGKCQTCQGKGYIII